MAKLSYLADEGLCLATYDVEVLTTDLQSADEVTIGMLPTGTVYGVYITSTDLDTNGTAALVQKLTIGGVDVATGINVGQAGGTAHIAIPPTALAESTEAKLVTTTSAATAATGTVKLAFLIQR